jgi:hypothetical protein
MAVAARSARGARTARPANAVTGGSQGSPTVLRSRSMLSAPRATLTVR